jgi:hypothetical protein
MGRFQRRLIQSTVTNVFVRVEDHRAGRQAVRLARIHLWGIQGMAAYKRQHQHNIAHRRPLARHRNSIRRTLRWVTCSTAGQRPGLPPDGKWR